MHTIADLPLVGGHPALDLVNSRERGIPRPHTANHDFLQSAADALIWARRAGVIDDDEAMNVEAAWHIDTSTARRELGRLLQVREALHAQFVAAASDAQGLEAAASRGELARLDREWRRAAARSTLRPREPGGGVEMHVGVDAATVIADRAVQAGVALLSGDQLDRIGRCPIEAGGCGWLFFDSTRNHSRRWCRMADCGNQVKSERLTDRRRRDRRATDNNCDPTS